MAMKRLHQITHAGHDRGIVKHFTVPSDVLMDVLYIIHRHKIRFQISRINREENTIMLDLYHGEYAGQVIENIEYILSEYTTYLMGAPSTLDYDED